MRERGRYRVGETEGEEKKKGEGSETLKRERTDQCVGNLNMDTESTTSTRGYAQSDLKQQVLEENKETQKIITLKMTEKKRQNNIPNSK